MNVNGIISIGENEVLEVPLYKKLPINQDEESTENNDSNILYLLKDKDKITILKKQGEYSFIEINIDDLDRNYDFNEDKDLYIQNDDVNSNNLSHFESMDTIQGYVENRYIVIEDEDDSFSKNDKQLNNNDASNIDDSINNNANDNIKYSSNTTNQNNYITSTFSINQTSFIGVALNSPTNVYSKQSLNSDILKSYPNGSILKYSSFSKDWYQTGVFINGKKHTGYIHKSHVENATQNSESLQGVGLKSPTHVYASASTSSKSLKSYSAGSVLKYSTFSENWYQTGVFINGKKHTGYIHKSHVENATQNSESLQGVGLKSPTHVYASASTSSKSLKSYSAGSVLKYSTFSENWYQTGVFINGKKHTGYIHKSHVENATQNPESLQGVGLKSPTHVYASASTSSKSLKSYSVGSVLKYSTFSENWYQTGVFINGKRHTGYIHKSHVENATQNPESLQGVGLKSPTHVYASASTSSRSLKSYSVGSVLKYSTISENWYQTGVFINGKRHTGYIHKSHVENATQNPESLQGVGLKSPTHVYASASTSSRSLKSYSAGSVLKYSTFSENWYQ